MPCLDQLLQSFGLIWCGMSPMAREPSWCMMQRLTSLADGIFESIACWGSLLGELCPATSGA